MPSSPTRPSVLDDIAPLHVLGEEFRPLITQAAFELFEVRAVADAGPPPHAHPWDEGYLVLDGELAVERAEECVVLGRGQAIHVAANTLHAYRVVSPTIRFLTITAPAGAGAFFADMDAHITLPPDLPSLAAVAGRHQLVLPPLGQ
jgi:quercetin dioxygenase-like cupin family protein